MFLTTHFDIFIPHLGDFYRTDFTAVVELITANLHSLRTNVPLFRFSWDSLGFETH